MLTASPSRTAQRVAVWRAAHQLFDTPLVFADPLAMRMAGRDGAEELRTRPGKFRRRGLATALRAFLAVRSRVAEDELARRFSDGIRQYVLLGAGLDTFAYRNAYPPGQLRIFEVDHPATQSWKRQRLEDESIAVPGNVLFVPVDFERQSLADELARGGFDRSTPTLFAWLGVVPYLTLASILVTLEYIASATERGGGVVFDYSVPPAELGWIERLAFKFLASRLRKTGEPFKTFFEPAALTQRLRSMGFTDVEDLDGQTLNRRYLSGRSDRLRVGRLGHVMKAFR